MEKRVIRFEHTPIMLKALKLADYKFDKFKMVMPYGVKAMCEFLMDVKIETGFMVYDRKEFVNKIAKAFSELGYEVDISPIMLKVGYTLVAVADTSYLQEIEQKAGKSKSIYVSTKKLIK